MRFSKVCILVTQICLYTTYLFAQEQQGSNIELSSIISANDWHRGESSSSAVYLSRYNLRVNENGRYLGLRYLELSGQIDRVDSNGSQEYRSSFWNTSESTRDLRVISAPIDNFQNYDFTRNELLYSSSVSQRYPDHLYYFPEYRNFPIVPTATLERFQGEGIPTIGYTYEDYAYRLIDPEGTGNFTPFRILVRYIYRGIGEHLGEDAHIFDADFAIRSDGQITGIRAQGSNKVSIIVNPGPTPRVFMRNIISEVYTVGQKTIQLEGFGLTWIRSPDPVYNNPNFIEGLASYSDQPQENENSSIAINSDESQIQKNENPSIAINSDQLETPENENPLDTFISLPSKIESESGEIDIIRDPIGLKLSIPNIRFKPDSSEILPSEANRLRIVADILKTATERRFLVVGHSASVGRPVGELELSIQRAEGVTQFLSTEGIQPGLMRYEGRGSSEPIADNASESGRALNRRVEIIILN